MRHQAQQSSTATERSRLVDIGHYEVQITPDNCSTSLISVDQIVADGHTVTFSATETIITDDNDRYRLG